MIRALALALSAAMALPAQAQDFRGLLPGMPASELARLGEPFRIDSEGGFTAASYPLPFERTLDVLYADGTLIFVDLSAPTLPSLSPPANGGLQVGETRLRAAVRRAGPGGFGFEALQSLPSLPPSGWQMSYVLDDHPDLILTLTFYATVPGREAGPLAGVQDMPQDALLIGARLTNPDIMAGYDQLNDLMPPVPPDGAIPLAPPLSDAFPLIDLPQ